MLGVVRTGPGHLPAPPQLGGVPRGGAGHEGGRRPSLRRCLGRWTGSAAVVGALPSRRHEVEVTRGVLSRWLPRRHVGRHGWKLSRCHRSRHRRVWHGRPRDWRRSGWRVHHPRRLRGVVVEAPASWRECLRRHVRRGRRLERCGCRRARMYGCQRHGRCCGCFRCRTGCCRGNRYRCGRRWL